MMSRRCIALLAGAGASVLCWAGAAQAPVAPLRAGSGGKDAYQQVVAVDDAAQAQWIRAGRRRTAEPWSLRNEIVGVWGLGPTFNENACLVCHANNGRAGAPLPGEEAAGGMVVRLSLPGEGANGAPLPHPNYGDQLQNRGVAKRVPAEGRAIVTYEPIDASFADGELVTLRRPRFEFRHLAYGELGAEVQHSPRLGPPLFGLGLLEAVPEADVLALAAQQAAAGQVSGRPNYVWNEERRRRELGRFGWKANQPSVRQQIAAALLNDIGATSSIFPDENCPLVQTLCLTEPTNTRCGKIDGACGGQFLFEVLPSRLDTMTLYLQALLPPPRREPENPEQRAGAKLFDSAGCAACHVPRLLTGEAAALPALAQRSIDPYTDLLLHDMGPALADNRPDFMATGSEWRTAPLWGLGWLATVNGHTDLLHDGRARNVTEAILWHGGEAQAARDAFVAFSRAERRALVAFVGSL
jgi:CxxC motif-containing protein (DUF1111 family)